MFGGGRLPATGCAFRFDTLFDVAAAADAQPQPGIVLEPAAATDLAKTVGLAEGLRDRGLRVGAAGAAVATVAGGRVRLADGAEVEAAVDALAAAVTRARMPAAPRERS